VLAGLAHGEAHRIVHRDLKPENLLVAVRAAQGGRRGLGPLGHGTKLGCQRGDLAGVRAEQLLSAGV